MVVGKPPRVMWLSGMGWASVVPCSSFPCGHCVLSAHGRGVLGMSSYRHLMLSDVERGIPDTPCMPYNAYIGVVLGAVPWSVWGCYINI